MQPHKIGLRIVAVCVAVFLANGANAQEYSGDFNQKTVAFSSELPLREGRLVGVLLSDWVFCYKKQATCFACRVPT